MIVSGPPPRRYPWQPMTIAGQLERTAARHPDNLALVDDSRRMTWSEVRAEARRLGRSLMAAGIERGDHMAVWLPNQIEWVLCWLGAAYAGAVIVPVNTRYKTEEAGYILRQSDSRLLFMRHGFLGIEFAPMLAKLAPGTPGGSCPDLRMVVTVDGQPLDGTIALDEFLASGDTIPETALDERAASVSPDDPTIIVYTSGTTGRPKGAVHSHNVLRHECSVCEWLDIDPDSRILGHMPLFHVAGSLSAVLPAVIAGCALVLMDHWDSTRALELIEREGITSFSGIPTHFIDVLNHPDLARHDVSTLRSGWIGGASNPREVMEGAMDRLGIRRLMPVYGMTETTSVTTYPRPEDPREVVLTGRGVPIADFELKVVDVSDGRTLGPGEDGEVCVRGHLVMQGYYRNPEATRAVIDEDGWFHTGDLGNLDENGYLAITGRKSDMFIVGGANAYPAEIEAVLASHPDVVQAYVVGAPDPRLGEVGCAFVQTRNPGLQADAIRAFVRERLANFKVPRHVIFVEEWPMTATGKIERFRLKEFAREAPGRNALP